MTPTTVKIEYGVSRPYRLGNVFESRITEFDCKEDAEASIERDGGTLVCRTVLITDWTLAEVDEEEPW